MQVPGRDSILNDATFSFAGDVLLWMSSQKDHLGSVFRCRLVQQRCVVVAGYAACSAALSDEALIASEAYAGLLSGILGETTMLTMRDDSDAAEAAKLVLLHSLNSNFQSMLVNHVVPTLCERIQNRQGEYINLYELVRDVFTDVLIEYIIGPQHMEDGEVIMKLLKEHFRAASKPPIRGGIGGIWKTAFQRGLDSKDELLKKFGTAIATHKIEHDEPCGPSCPSLLCSILRVNAERKTTGKLALDDDQLGGILLVLSNSIIPKTVATLVASTAAAIAQDKSLHERLRSERQRQSSTTLQHCLKETGRLWPALIAAPRRCVRDTIIQGFQVPKDRYVIISLLTANRDKQVFGDDGDLFRPARWETDGDPPPEPLTWGGGRRKCVGQPVAEILALSILTELLESYTIWELHSKAEPNKFKWLPVAAHQSPIKFRFSAQRSRKKPQHP